MFKHTSKASNRFKRSLKASAVFSDFVPVALFVDESELAPYRARRMSNHGPRPVVLACITKGVPKVHVRQACIDAFWVDVKRGNHIALAGNCSRALRLPPKNASSRLTTAVSNRSVSTHTSASMRLGLGIFELMSSSW